jgi:hypothetical protein
VSFLANQKAVSTLHIIVLVHGWLGNPKEMDYLKQSLVRQALEAGPTTTTATTTTATETTASATACKNPAIATVLSRNQHQHAFVVYSAEANSGTILTSDGIVAGGRRIANEIDQLVQRYTTLDHPQQQQQQPPNITLSLVGNSLGGLYCRYAISELQALQLKTVMPKLFVTTCTPHLGVSQHTFITLPSWIESPIARVMQQTGLDLFRRTSCIQEMTTQSRFVNPLRSFSRRIAFANVYGTDFQVPTATAAFWAPTESMHYEAKHLVDNEPENNHDEDGANNNIVLQLVTHQCREHSLTETETETDPQLAEDNNYKNIGRNQLSSQDLSVLLDEMGWTKVLVDVRHHLPLSFGRTRAKRSIRRSPSSSQAKQESKWTARELLEEFDTGYFRSFPLGHTVMVANSKDTVNQYLNAGGKATMDYLASTMVQQLLLDTTTGSPKPK